MEHLEGGVYVSDENEVINEEEDEELDPILQFIGELILPKPGDVWILEQSRVKDLEEGFLYVKKAIPNINSNEMTYGQSEDFPDVGFIEIESEQIEVTNIEAFIHASELASNSFAYPICSGTVRLEFGFNGLSKRIRS